MGLAEKAFGLVSRASPRSTQQDDAILLFSDRAVTRSPFTKNMGVQPLSEDLILTVRTDSNRPLAALQEVQIAAGRAHRVSSKAEGDSQHHELPSAEHEKLYLRCLESV